MTTRRIISIILVLEFIWVFFVATLFYLHSTLIKEYIESYKALQEEIKNIPTYQRKLENLKEKLNKKEEVLNALKYSAVIEGSIMRLAEKYNFEKFSVIEKGRKEDKVNLEIQVVSEFRKIADFISSLENSELPVNITSLSIKKMEGEKKISVTMEISIEKVRGMGR